VTHFRVFANQFNNLACSGANRLVRASDSSVITEVSNWTHIMDTDDILRKRSSNFKLKILNSSNTVMSSLCDVL